MPLIIYKKEGILIMEKNKKHSLKITFILISILVVLSIIILLFVPTIQESNLYTQLKEKEQKLWISSSTLLPLQYTSYNEGTPTTFYFTFQPDSVTDEDVKIPDFSDYSFIN